MKQPSPLRNRFQPRSPRHSLLALGALLVACGSEPARPDTDASLTLARRQAWAGGTLDLYSSTFQGARALPVVLLDTAAFAADRVNDTTLRVTIPATYAGEYLVSASVDGRLVPGPAVEVAGYLGGKPTAQSTNAWYFRRVVPSSNPSAISAVDGRPAIVDLATGGVQVFPVPQSRLVAPGSTYLPGVYLVEDLDDIVAYRLAEPPVQIDTVSPAVSFYQTASWLGPGIVVGGTSKHVILQTPDSTKSWLAAYPGPLIFSLRGDRATYPTACGYSPNLTEAFPGGHPVLSVPDARLAFTIPQRNPAAVDFSPDGTLLGVAGDNRPRCGSEDSTVGVFLYRASDGSLVAQAPLPKRHPIGFAFDPVRPYVYVALGEVTSGDGSVLSVVVLDRTTLTRVGQMDTDFVDAFSFDNAYTVMDFGADNTLYVLYRRQIARFSLLPP